MGTCVVAFAASSAVAPAAPAAAPGRWVAMGDSYQSGVGTDDYDAASGDCKRSKWAYAPLLDEDGVPGGPFSFVACAGAKIKEVRDGKSGEASQLSALGSDVSHVTIGVSGNDMGFSGVVKRCVLRLSDEPCNYAEEDGLKAAFAKLDAGTEQSTNPLQTLLKEIQERAAEAEVFVPTYPKFFPDEGGFDGTGGHVSNKRCQNILTVDQLWMNQWAQRLDNLIVTSATMVGAVPIDLYHATDDHEICPPEGKERFLNGIVPFELGDSFHPTRAGYANTACIIKEAFLQPTAAPRLAGDGGVTRRADDVTVQPGQTVQVPVTLAGGGLGAGFGASWTGGDVKMRVLSPDGRQAPRAEQRRSGGKRGLYNSVYVPGAAAGGWKVELTGGDRAVKVRVTTTELARPKTPPVAKVTMKRTGPKTVVLDASGSTGSAGGEIKRYLWEFTDGTFATGAKVTHAFAKPGTYVVGLAITGDDGQLGFGSSAPVEVAAE
ncbi:PKD domain-containing protein [Actinomadura sp. GTD37]|uniref:PKD domain-containing protein n=1 Tax=Actinomadura sp. GTD37 TaxID=1778030 RepID=UPI0035BED1EC